MPLAIMGVLPAQWLRGLTDDVFCQIGLVMLIGLASKNAILIVEFANQIRKSKGTSIVKSVINAAEERLRPIFENKCHRRYACGHISEFLCGAHHLHPHQGMGGATNQREA
nr:efflux RND transporter permease subunit [uncultured Thermosynechococcus sp.]